MIKRREYTDIPTDQNILLYVLRFWNNLLHPPNCVQNKIKKTQAEAERNVDLYISVQSLAFDCRKAIDFQFRTKSQI
jgi:hypothetical protein